MFIGEKFSSQNVFQGEQPWKIPDGGVKNASNFMFMLKQQLYN